MGSGRGRNTTGFLEDVDTRRGRRSDGIEIVGKEARVPGIGKSAGGVEDEQPEKRSRNNLDCETR